MQSNINVGYFWHLDLTVPCHGLAWLGWTSLSEQNIIEKRRNQEWKSCQLIKYLRSEDPSVITTTILLALGRVNQQLANFLFSSWETELEIYIR